LFDADVEALVNAVNVHGHMGKGLALTFAQTFPEILAPYKMACESGGIAPGKLHVVEREGVRNPRYVINFPTKRHWRDRSRFDDVEAGLVDLARVVREYEIRSIAIPALGCGLGGLAWSQVWPAIERIMQPIDGVDIRVFPPQEAPLERRVR
jgi:O-acetyl-ADP-ribose deacetylase (regulator of RNase III)